MKAEVEVAWVKVVETKKTCKNFLLLTNAMRLFNSLTLWFFFLNNKSLCLIVVCLFDVSICDAIYISTWLHIV